MNRSLLGNKGLTLVELILTISIISIVIFVIFSFLEFNYISFNRSNTNYNLQVSLNDIQRKIERELKYAEKITVYETLEELGEYNNYIYLENNQIKIKTMEDSYSITDTDMILITDLKFELNDNMLKVFIEGKSPDLKTVRNIEYSVELLNVINGENKSGHIIQYSMSKGDD